ncbi:MAG: uridine kinase [Planctomycetota bacterium]
MTPTPRTITFADATEAILEVVRARGQRTVIGVTGAVAAGKSTLARTLSECVVSTDNYLPDYHATAEHLRDLPESSDLERLARDIAALRSGCGTNIPLWTFAEHRRIGEQRVETADVVVVEGLHALHALPRQHIDIAVFVEASQPTRWQRAVSREQAGDRPWPIEYLEKFFHSVAEPTFALHADGYRRAAHFVVINDTASAQGS